MASIAHTFIGPNQLSRLSMAPNNNEDPIARETIKAPSNDKKGTCICIFYLFSDEWAHAIECFCLYINALHSIL